MPDNTKWYEWKVPLNDRLDPTTQPPPRAGEGETEPPHPLPSDSGGFFLTHPRYRTWLAKCGVTSTDTALALPGEVVSGHVDRHVVRVELHSGSGHRTVYLKREHTAGRKARLRNRLAGFGWVSRCEREAMILAKLEEAGLPGPQWLAYGEDSTGRAFVLVDELAGSSELRTYLGEYSPPEEDRRLLCERIGRVLAELHAAGFATPDLAAKHLFVQHSALAVSLIDWQSCPPVGSAIDPRSVARWFGMLHATLADHLASSRDRLRVLWAYRRTFGMIRRKQQTPPPFERFGGFVRAITLAAEAVAEKSSVRSQWQPLHPDVRQRLVWLADEAVVAIPEVAAIWPKPIVGPPFYSDLPAATPPDGTRERYTFPDGRKAILVRFTTIDPIGRLTAAIRERPWRSPAATAARILFHLQRHGIPAPRLLAFGQRTVSFTTGESFLVGELPPNVSRLSAWLTRLDLPIEGRTWVLKRCGQLLRRMHNARVRLAPNAGSNDPLFVVSQESDSQVFVGSPFAVRLSARMSESTRIRDLKLATAGWCRTDRVRFLCGYWGNEWADRRRTRLTVKVV